MNLFKLVATVGIDSSEYDKGVKDATSKGKSLASGIGHAMGAATKAVTAGVTAATTAVGALTTMAVKNYADYEQLVGGVETLFKDSAGTIKEFAADAYKTAGLSANEYMETVTDFSASLIQSLGGDTKKAATVADKAVKDMSDNANKMGTSMKSIQFAYQGFAKGNMTMLDNLKLGYGGTKEEMQRLLEDANELNEQQGIHTDYQIDRFSDIVEAIHVVQTQMGIYGTTAREAASTITGSIETTKSAWKNLVVGFGDENADLKKLTKDLVDSFVIAVGNVVPRVRRVLSGIKEVGVELTPKIAEGISEAVRYAPEFLTAGLDILTTLGNSLIDQSGELMDSAFVLLNTLLDGINSDPGAIFNGMSQLLTTFAQKLQENGPTLFDKAYDLLVGEDGNGGLIGSFVDNAPEMVIAAVEIIAELASGLLEKLPDLLGKIPGMVEDIANEFAKPENIERMKDAGKKLGEAFLNALPSMQDAWNWVMKHSGLPQVPSLSYDKSTGQYYDRNTPRTKFNPVTGKLEPSSASDRASSGAIHGAGNSRPPRKRPHNYLSVVDINGSHANGLDYVPFDGYIAELHKGERVLTADEARATGTTQYNTFNINGGDFGDRRELVEYIAEALQTVTDRRVAVNG